MSMNFSRKVEYEKQRKKNGTMNKLTLLHLLGWHRGVAVECQTRDQEVAGLSLGRALWRKNSGQVSHTYVPLSPSSITWYWPKGGDA